MLWSSQLYAVCNLEAYMLFHSDLTRFCRRLDCSSCWLGTMGREKGQGCEVAAGVAVPGVAVLNVAVLGVIQFSTHG